MAALAIHAGPTARKRLLESGLQPDHFKVMVGASGGPKWFVLYGLDRYLFGEFFATRQQPLVTLGSSAGAWRMCCLATADPLAAIERLATLYSEERYAAKPTAREVSAQARQMLVGVLGKTGAAEIVANTRFCTHIATDRCRGPGSSRSTLAQMLLLASSATLNMLDRRTLSWFYERTLFTNMGDLSPWKGLDDISTNISPLTEDNLFDAMMASGAIPFVLEGVRDIPGAKPGLYWDGGIVDYHFDLPFNNGEELVLYPHFLGAVVPGWFDKHLPWRRAHASHYENVVILAPSPEFVASLPNGKLPDRMDFKYFDYPRRLKIFRQALHRSQELADELAAVVANGIKAEQIQPIGNLS